MHSRRDDRMWTPIPPSRLDRQVKVKVKVAEATPWQVKVKVAEATPWQVKVKVAEATPWQVKVKVAQAKLSEGFRLKAVL